MFFNRRLEGNAILTILTMRESTTGFWSRRWLVRLPHANTDRPP
jgi:hypothetical protein